MESNMELFNLSTLLMEFNGSFLDDEFFQHNSLMNEIWIQCIFGFLYVIIFVLGVSGNILVCYIVFRDKPMQTITNIFISNLALADILLCLFCVPITPLYTFIGRWIFGSVLCKLVPFLQGVAIYVSTLTLTAIAIDRYFVIIHPFKDRMKISNSIKIILGIWIFSFLSITPYGIFTSMLDDMCVELWPSEYGRYIYGVSTVILQFIVPFVIITYCYVRVSIKLQDRARLKPGSQASKKEEVECRRKHRTNRMLIAMVAIFGFCWLPINVINLTADLHYLAEVWEYYDLLFFVSHTIAMSSTCYNPFLYSWLNKNFRKQFCKVLPCFTFYNKNQSRISTNDMETMCNGNENTAETTLLTNVFLKDEITKVNDEGLYKVTPNSDAIQLKSITVLLEK